MIRFDKRITQSYYVHRLVAEAFIPKERDDQHYVTHLDYDKSNNHVSNLKWVSERELADHNNKNPRVMKKRVTGYKLTESDVKVIKKMLKNEKTRFSQIARQFGITHTQLNRIRKGQNWGHVTIDD
jgi:transcriptional regulator with GAF, ATPase, and Fis domain